MTRLLALLRGFRDVFRIWLLGYGVKVIPEAMLNITSPAHMDSVA